MAAKKLAKETGIPLPKASKIPKTKKKTTLVPKPKTELKPAPNSPSKINNHAELYRLMQEEKNSILGPNDIDYLEKRARVFRIKQPKILRPRTRFSRRNGSISRPQKALQRAPQDANRH